MRDRARAGSRAVVGAVVFATLVTGCRSASRERSDSPSASLAPAPAAKARPGEAVEVGHGRFEALAFPIIAIGEASEGGGLALGRIRVRRVAFVADEDEQTIATVEVDAHGELARTKVDGRVAQLLVGKEGLLYASLRDAAAVVALRAESDGSLVEVARAATPLEPIGLSRTADGSMLLATCAAGHALVALDARSLERRFVVDLPRGPRAVALSQDDAFAFVVHATGSIVSRVALAASSHQVVPIRLDGRDVETLSIDGETARRFHALRVDPEPTFDRRFTAQGFSVARAGERLLAPAVVAHRSEGQGSSSIYGASPDAGFLPEEPAIIDLDAERPEARVRVRESVDGASFSRQSTNGSAAVPLEDPCMLPRAAVFDARSHRLFVACLGSDEVQAFDAAPKPLGRSVVGRWRLPAGVVALAIDPTSREAFVWSSFARVLSVFSIEARGGDVAKGTELPARAPQGELVALGRRLFHAADARISADGRSCASCHAEGRDDGLVWSTPSGPRRTPDLAGRIEGTAPYGWGGESKTLPAHLAHTVKRLGGKGLGASEVDALAAYLLEMTPPPRRARDERAARGEQLFRSDRFGCTTCHLGDGRGVDGRAHDVGGGAAFDTPSLRFVGASGAYFHDGRFTTLTELLRETRGSMGFGEGSSDDDVDALAAYLETL